MKAARAIAIFLVASLSARAGASSTSSSEAEETVAYFGDPQIGFGKSGWQEDEARFAAAAKAVSGAVAAVVVAGDLVNVWDNSTLTRGFDQVWHAMLDAKWHFVPGNHDVNSEAPNASEFETQLSHFRRGFGRDYHSFRTRHASFIMLDSELAIVPHLGLNGTALDAFLANETEAQWAWLEEELAAAQRASPHTIVVSHHPPFLKSAEEPHVYWNWPIGERRRLLGLLAKHGARTVLCGRF